MSVYLIDEGAVNDRIDWRHTPLIGGVTGQRSETFPGDGGVFIVKGEPAPDGVQIEGFIEASNHANLSAAVQTYAAMRRDRALHKVTFKGVDYTDQHLESVEFGPTRGFAAGAGVKVKVVVRFTWRGVTP